MGWGGSGHGEGDLEELALARRLMYCFFLFKARRIGGMGLSFGFAFLGLDDGHIIREKRLGPDEGLESVAELLFSLEWRSAGEEVPSVHPLPEKRGVYLWSRFQRRRELTASAKDSSRVGPVYSPGHAAVSEDTRA
jgi:hypothetical protein